MDTEITIDGDTYAFTPPVDHDFWVDGWGWDLDGDGWAEFHEMPSGSTPTYPCGKLVSITVDGTVRAAGEIVNVAPIFGEEGWVFGYRIRGFKYRLNRVPVTALDGTGYIVFNLPADDDDYIPSFAGQSVGEILDYVLTQHASQLAALGISTDATTAAQLAALTLVPLDPVRVAGERLANAIDGVLARDARNVVFCITAAGLVRFFDTTDLTDLTLTEGTDPVEPVRFSRDISDVATRVQVRGAANVFPAFVSQLGLSLTPAWTTPQKNAWSWNDFVKPNGAFDKGTIAPGGVLGPTSVRVTSSDAARTWASNFWPNGQAWIHLHSSVGSALAYTESRPVTANTALTAAGTSDITLGYDLENAGSSAFDSYELVGTYAPLGSGGFERNNVYRLFDITDPGGQIADHLVKKFPVPQPFISYSGDATSMTNYPIAVIVKNGQTFPVTFKILPATGQILFDEPVVKPLNSISVLTTGGASVAYPDDLYVLLAYSRGPLVANYPLDVGGLPQYAGTGFTVDGIERTQTIDMDSWVYAGNQAQLEAYAEMMHKSICDTILTGSVQYRGAYEDAFEPGVRLSIGATCYTTGLESAAVPIRSFSLRYNKSGSPQVFTSTLGCSSRRNPACGDRQFTHLTSQSQAAFKLELGGGFSRDQIAAIANTAAAAGNLSSGSVAGLPGGGPSAGSIADFLSSGPNPGNIADLI